MFLNQSKEKDNVIDVSASREFRWVDLPIRLT